MPDSPAVIFDDGKGALAPLRDLRSLDALRCGGLTTAERWARTLGLVWSAVLVPGELADIARDGGAAPVNPADPQRGTAFIVNARAPIVPSAARNLPPGTALVEGRSGELVAARADAALLPAIVRGDLGGLARVDLDGPWSRTSPCSPMKRQPLRVGPAGCCASARNRRVSTNPRACTPARS